MSVSLRPLLRTGAVWESTARQIHGRAERPRVGANGVRYLPAQLDAMHLASIRAQCALRPSAPMGGSALFAMAEQTRRRAQIRRESLDGLAPSSRFPRRSA